ncbi:MAG TPA: hypothetical protein VNP94_05945 [Actinomycetota bacterium]|nr:hypothetical protein [Actinomycetota bacterium]
MITFSITWNPADWASNLLDRVADCFQLNGQSLSSLNVEEKPTVNDGSFTHTITVPSDLEPGDVLCDRARLSGDPAGDNVDTQKSNKLCFTVGEQPPPPGQITIVKQTDPDGADQEFDFSGDLEDFRLADGESQTFDLRTGTYSVTESVPEGWELDRITCTGGEGDQSDWTIDVENGTVSIDLAEGGSVRCTFFNREVPPPAPGQITIVKNAVPDDPQDFGFSGDLGPFTLDDDADPTLPNSRTFSNLQPGSYSVSEGAVSGWSFSGASCTVQGEGGSTWGTSGSEATIELATGDHVTCTFTNVKATTPPPPSPSPSPTPSPQPPAISVDLVKVNDADQDGRFTDDETANQQGQDVTFRVTITNTSSVNVVIQSLTDQWPGQVPFPVSCDEGNLVGTVLSPGQSVTCTFTIEDYAPVTGDAPGSIVDTAAVTVGQQGNESNAASDQDDSTVRVQAVLGETVTPPAETTTPPGGVAFTGAEVTRWGLLALALLLAGSGLLWLSWRSLGEPEA